MADSATEASDSLKQSTLTRLEWSGLIAEHNLADGHARHGTTAVMSGVVDRLPSVFRAVENQRQVDVQRQFEESFFRAAGQASVLGRSDEPLYHYSSSVSIEVVANHLRLERLRVGLLHPTFDNIPDILRRHQVPLVPVTERIFSSPESSEHWGDFDALFLVAPNNPTGLDAGPASLERIAVECRRRGVLLIVDFSFRFFSDRLKSRDSYAFFNENGIDHIGIEDVGKVWPLLDLKIGILVSGPRRHAALRQITDDMLLNVSPFVLSLLTESERADVVEQARDLSVRNRATLVRALEGGPLSVVDGGRTMSVGWIRLPDGWRSAQLCAWLGSRGIALLPGEPFYWADPNQGSRFVRVALMRPIEPFALSAAALAETVTGYRPEQPDTTGETAGTVERAES